MVVLETAEFASPIGVIVIALRDDKLCALSFGDHWPAQARWLEKRFGNVSVREAAEPPRVLQSLAAYFAGQLRAFDGLALDPGGTPFQARVWSELRQIPPGQTISYGRLAAAIGSPQAARAVGLANARNPISIVVPCHRAIGADSRLVGYGGGLDRKRWLLRHEGAHFAEATETSLPFESPTRMAV